MTKSKQNKLRQCNVFTKTKMQYIRQRFLVGQGPVYQNFEETYFVSSFTNTFTTL